MENKIEMLIKFDSMKAWIYALLIGLFSLCFLCSTSQSAVKLSYNENQQQNDPSCKDCNVIFISLTNVRADHLESYGYSRKTSPCIDTFFQQSIVFQNAFSVASWTLPVTMSIYTSTYPFAHKVVTRDDGMNVDNRLSNTTLTLVDILKRSGYETASFNAGRDFLPQYGLMNRFDKIFSSGVQDVPYNGEFRGHVRN